MTFRDLLDLSVGSLWRIKLRAFLTIAGVVIAIAMFVAMLSFAAGNHKYVSTTFNQFGLLTNMNVYPKDNDAAADTTDAVVLDRDAIETLSAIPGVELVYPFVDFEVTASVADTQVTTTARVLPTSATRTKLFSTLLAGLTFSSDDAPEAIVTPDFLELVGIEDTDSLVGKTLIISAKSASLDSALINAVGDADVELRELMRTVRFDSLSDPRYQRRVIQRELSGRLDRFFDGLMNRQVTVSDTLVIRGVGGHFPSQGVRTNPIVISEGTARKLNSAGIGLGSDPTDLLEAIRDGELFRSGGSGDIGSYPRVTMEIDPLASHAAVKDSVEALGFRAFSFAEQFEEIQRFFIYYYLGLGVIGFIALVTASLGIVNTMIMSITERRREIGILKSLGADEQEIRLSFLVESSVIGAIGSVIGILCGWGASRVVSAVIKAIMEREEMLVFELFALPFWLILLAFSFGVGISLLAGLYPASRAARVDPVESLRSE